MITDALIVIWATVGAYIIRFQSGILSSTSSETTAYAVFTTLLAALWWLMLGAMGSRETTILGSGIEEYKRILTSSFALFGAIAIISYAFQFEIARGYVGLALPVGVLSLLTGRWAVRRLLRYDRYVGNSNARVVVVGGDDAVKHLVSSFKRQPDAGYQPVAACVAGDQAGNGTSTTGTLMTREGVDLQTIVRTVEESEADTVAISAGSQISPQDLRRLGWKLAELRVSLILAPALTDVAGPRIHTQPVAGLPLVHVSTPKLSGGHRLTKRVFDVAASVALLLILSPIFVLTATLIKITSPGPIFYRQERIGIHGKTFHMIKFRSMTVNADSQLLALLREQGTDGAPLSKIDNDPRITPIGKILRKFSIDELPQLLNVVAGSMSLVGPRPQRAHEVALYSDGAHRRLYVSPGMSGLWQVSGRSNLTWDEAIRLDLYYVENWSLTQDIIILLRTFRAVLKSDGAV
ncbi:sugar transferase [Arthrobacter sp. 3Tela_A]|uniref:sugar transferase n=1 Tax=Arthrobacter sp. 3Tela_A TaxID=3093743 RepID=UPI003BB790D2